MTTFSLNPPSPSFPLTDQIEDQNQLFISPRSLDSTNSLSCRSFFNILDQTQTRQAGELRHDQEEDGLGLHGGSSCHQICNSSFNSQPVMEDRSKACGYKVEEEERKNEHGSAKWMSSKMRLMQKMMTPNANSAPHRVSNITPTFQNLEHQKTRRSPPSHRNSTITRVCADCNTTSTPLWRGGPKGPKSLCNACGIRQRKARRAMAEAANGGVSSRMHSKEKKPRTNHFVQFKNKCKATSSSSGGTSREPESTKNIGFKDFAFSLMKKSMGGKEFPRDEVAEAALLLMDLSCAFVPV